MKRWLADETENTVYPCEKMAIDRDRCPHGIYDLTNSTKLSLSCWQKKEHPDTQSLQKKMDRVRFKGDKVLHETDL